MGYNLRLFMGVLRFFYGFLCFFMVDFAQVLGWARCEFTDIYGLFTFCFMFFMVFLWFFYAFHAFFYGFLWLVYGRWVQLRNCTVILRAWLLKLWLFYGFGSCAWRGE